MTTKKHEIPDELVAQLLAGVEKPEDLVGEGGLLRALTGRLMEKSLEAELTDHLGYDRREARPSTNSRNGHGRKAVLTDAGKVEIKVPRDRDGTFDPQLVKKHQRRMSGFDERIIAMYARGMSVREIQDFFLEAYDAEISPTLISRVTDAVLEDVEAWRQRRLERVYPVVFLDGLVVKVKTDGVVQNRTVYIALGINKRGTKDVLGLWMGHNEGAKFWLHVVTELRNRGVEDILIACVDGLKGFPEAIEAVFPRTTVQTCIVHMIRNSLRYVAYTNRRAVAKSLKPVYAAATEDAAKAALEAFDAEWGDKYPTIAMSWRANWERWTPFLAFPDYIRKAIYTTNAVEAVNRQLRKVLKTKGHFPSEDAVMKTLFLTLNQASKRWTMPITQWDLALQQFAIHFDGRINL